MEIREYKSLSEYINQRLTDRPTMLFRGVSDSSYQLIPSIGRQTHERLDFLYRFEKEIFDEFKQKAFPYISKEPNNQVEWLFLAQHYGIPTRLLDWTENPLVALYFACEQNADKECAVYKIHISTFYTDLENLNPFEVKEIAGLKPRHTDIRYINQVGRFTIHPEPTKPIEDNSLVKCVFSPKTKETIRWQLRKMGIHSTLIYPSLESVAKDIVSEEEGILSGGTVRASGNMFEL